MKPDYDDVPWQKCPRCGSLAHDICWIGELTNPPPAASGNALRAALFQALGQWSVEICRPEAELAPPQYLLDAIDAAMRGKEGSGE